MCVPLLGFNYRFCLEKDEIHLIMKHNDLPERWKGKIISHLKSNGIHDRDKLSAMDFFIDKVVKIKFEDGSSAEFFYPLVIEAPEWNEAGIFTEHCGSHIFGMQGVDIHLMER